MKKHMIVLTAAACGGIVLHGGNLIQGGDAEGTENPWGKKTTVVTAAPHAGKACYAITETVATANSPLIPVDPAKKYRLSGALKSADGEKLSICCFGIAMYDAGKRPIHKSNVWVVPGTETELAAPAEKGAQEIRITNGDKWNKRRSTRSQVAFNVKGDGSDMPNFELTSLISRVKKSGDGQTWTVIFDRPLGKAYPAGTPVRQHFYGASLDCCLAWRSVPAVWTTYKAEIGGMAPAGQAPANQFWHGCKYVSIYILNDAGRKGAAVHFDDIVFEEIW